MADSLVGTTLLGKLRVIRQLGQGGMGTVYEVEHTLTNHRRALKLLRPEVAFDADVVARFIREAGVAGTLGTERVVQTFDAGRLDDGSLYVLMELLEGESLADRLTRGPLTPSDAIQVAQGVCEGLHAAHAKGIIHRDIKPDNVFLVDRSTAKAKIIDFGISKFATSKLDVETASGMMMGTPYYAAPEQLRNAKGVDARADVYALGVMLYEMVSGVRPFEADGLAELIVRIMGSEMVPLAERVAELPVGYADVVARAMSVAADDRHTSVDELAEALARIEPGGGLALAETMDSIALARTMASNPPPADREEADEPKSSRAVVGAVIAILVASAVGVGVWNSGGSARDSEVAVDADVLDAGMSVPSVIDAGQPDVLEQDASGDVESASTMMSTTAMSTTSSSMMQPHMGRMMQTMARADGLEEELGAQ